MYFIVLFHIDSCDLGVLFGADKKKKKEKVTELIVIFGEE